MSERILVPVNNEPTRDPTCTILGSFRYKELIDQTIDTLESNRIKVLAPPKGKVTEEIAGFKILEGDDTSKMHWIELEDIFVRKMGNSDVLYVVNPEGYIGSSTLWELALATGQGIPAFGMERITKVADVDPREMTARMSYWSATPKPLAEFISMVKSGFLDVTDLIHYTHPSERPPVRGFIELPIRRPEGMPSQWWEETLKENQVPSRLVVPKDWPFS